jgi:hypothetical protein
MMLEDKMSYTAIEAKEYGVGIGPNGMGKRAVIRGAYVVDAMGRKVRSFRENEGGLAKAKEWANVLSERLGLPTVY